MLIPEAVVNNFIHIEEFNILPDEKRWTHVLWSSSIIYYINNLIPNTDCIFDIKSNNSISSRTRFFKKSCFIHFPIFSGKYNIVIKINFNSPISDYEKLMIIVIKEIHMSILENILTMRYSDLIINSLENIET